MSSMGNSSNAENVNTVRIDYRRKNLLPKLPEFRPDTDMAEPEFKVGLVFPNGKSFRTAVKQHSLRVGKQLWFKKNNSDKVRVQCRASGCPFVLYASLVRPSKTFVVKTYNSEHLCGRQHENKFANAEWLSKQYNDLFKVDQKCKVADIIEKVKKDFIVDVTPRVVYTARRLATTRRGVL